MAEARLESLRTLETFEAALRRFAAIADSTVESATGRFRMRVEALGHGVRRAESEVDTLRGLLAGDAEGDEVETSFRLEEAEDRLERIRGHLRSVEELSEAYSRSASRFRSTTDQQLLVGLAELSRATDLIRHYHAVHFDEARPGSSQTVTAISANHIPAAAPVVRSADDLPSGFVWIPIDQIEQSEFDTVDSFPKIAEEDMRQGLQLLKAELLPFLATFRGSSVQSALAEEDRRAGRQPPVSLLEVYHAFFGRQDYVYLTRGRHDTHFRVTNGRHRIKVAKELGWAAIPGQLKDLRADG